MFFVVLDRLATYSSNADVAVLLGNELDNTLHQFLRIVFGRELTAALDKVRSRTAEPIARPRFVGRVGLTKFSKWDSLRTNDPLCSWNDEVITGQKDNGLAFRKAISLLVLRHLLFHTMRKATKFQREVSPLFSSLTGWLGHGRLNLRCCATTFGSHGAPSSLKPPGPFPTTRRLMGSSPTTPCYTTDFTSSNPSPLHLPL